LTPILRPFSQEDSNSHSKISAPHDWIVGQQIGILAYALTQFDPKSARHAAGRELRIRCQDLLQNKLSEFRESQGHIGLLPISSLHLLSQPELKEALPRYFKPQHDKWTDTYAETTNIRWSKDATPRPSLAMGANLVAHQILFSASRPEAIVGACARFLGNKFREFQKSDLTSLRAPLVQVRNVSAHTRRLIDSIANLTAVLTKYSQSGVLVRNALLDLVFTWPILVFGKAETDPIGALSVPIAVDFVFNDRNDIVISPREFYEDTSTTAEEWKAELKKAVDVGKALWRSKNGNTGEWRNRVLRAQTVFDFRIAKEVIDGLGLRVSFRDRSMGPYYAQVILAKALGRHVGFTSAITGLIGEQRQVPSKRLSLLGFKEVNGAAAAALSLVQSPLEELEIPPTVEQDYVLDWGFSWASRVREKKRFVYGSFKFDRFILPPDNKPPSTAVSAGNDKYIETNHCRYLSNVADCVQIGGWRQFRYIRCPDISHTVHRNFSELPNVDTQEVAKCLALLSSQDEAILEIRDDCSVASLFAALRQINFVDRMKEARPAPTLSWTVIRTTDEELQTRFWHQVWRSIGAPTGLFNKFRLSRTPEEAALLLAQMLNRLEPTEFSRGERAPDLLIIVGTKSLKTSAAERNITDLARVRPHLFELVINALRALIISPVLDERYIKILGKTRIITIPTQEFIGHKAPLLTTLPDQDRKAAETLSVYRFGFTQQMASILLQDEIADPTEVRDLLRRLCLSDVVTYGDGWYRLRDFQESDLNRLQNTDVAILTKQHASAALGFAPYLATSRIPGLNIAASLLPENVREGQWHLKQAGLFGTRARQRDITRQARVAFEQLTRFFEIRTWGVVTELSERRSFTPFRETYEMAKDMLSEIEESKRKPLPTEFVTVAQAASRFFEEVNKRRDGSELAETLRQEAITLFERACSVLKELGFGVELALHVWTRYAAFLHYCGITEKEVSRRNALDQAICAEVERCSKALWPEGAWFECYADRLSDHKEALHYYLLGEEYLAGYLRNHIKALGAATLCNEPDRALLRSLQILGETRTKGLVEFSVLQNKFANPLAQNWVPLRWEAGIAFLKERFKVGSP
jgi:hypothetical protein